MLFSRIIKKSLLLVLFALPLHSFAQARPLRDSLQHALSLAKTDTDKVNTLIRLAETYSDSVHVLYYTNEALQLARRSGFRKGEGDAYFTLGNFYGRTQINYVKAVRWYTASLKVRQELGDKKRMAYCYLQLAIIDGRFKNYEKAIELLRKAEALNADLDNRKGLKSDYQAIAEMYMESQKWDSALFYFRRADALAVHTTASVAITDINLVSVFIGMQQYDSALLYIHKTDSVYGVLHNDFGVKWDKMNLGQIYLRQGDVKKALPELEAAYETGEQLHNVDLLLNVLPFLVDAYGKSGNYEKGFARQKEWIALNDSLQNTDKANSVLSEQIRYETEEQDQIDRLEKEKTEAAHKAEVKRQETITLSISVILVLALGLVFFVFRSYRQKKKANELISGQKMLLEEKQKAIVDSINYAKRLQEAILPPQKLLKETLPESFIFYQPKDIVAGDFYFLETRGDQVLFAVADCTGHGVPGALVSVVCSNALARAVKEFGLTEPGKILDKVRELVLETFEKSESDVKDGMDISLVCLSKSKRREIQWAGANNPLWLLHEGKIIETKANKQPVGKQENGVPFTTHSLTLAPGDTIYLFTDGYADQFGGPKGKKFRYKQLGEVLLQIAPLPMDEQKERLEEIFNAWKGPLEQIDDVCIAAIRSE